MRSSKLKMVGVVAVALVMVFGGAALAQEKEKIVEVKLKAVAECEEGEDCEARRVMFVSEDGTVTELEGEDHHWVSADEDGNVHKKVMVIGGDHDSEHNVWISEDGADHHVGPHEMANAVFFGGEHGGGYLGVQLTELTPELRTHFGVPENEGVMVSKVVEDSPAWQAGVRVGDIVAQVDGNVISSGVALQKSIGAVEPGETVALQVWRDGAIESLNATIVEREDAGELTFISKLHVTCEDDEDCDEQHVTVEVLGDEVGSFTAAHGVDFDCGDGEDCMIKVNCSDEGACTCIVNGEESDCESLPNVMVHRLHKDKE